MKLILRNISCVESSTFDKQGWGSEFFPSDPNPAQLKLDPAPTLVRNEKK